MKNFYLSLFISIFFLNNITSQCDPPPSQFCAGNDPLCSVDELDGYLCRTPNVPNPSGPDPLCGGMGAPENTLWWAFLGNGDFIGIRIVIDENSCMGMTLGCVGLEAGIVSNCLGTTLDCNANCDTTRPAIIEIGGLTVSCQSYYLWIDGCCGDVCDFTIETMSTGPPSLPDPLPIPEVQGRVCPCAVTKVCIGELSEVCPVRRQWMVDGVVLSDFDDLDCVEFEVGTDGSLIEVCVIFTLGNPLDSTAVCDQDMSCIRLLPEAIPLIDEGEVWGCWEQHLGGGFVWHDTIIFDDCINPPCKTRAQQPDDCCADFVAEIHILEEREYGERYEFFCDKSDLPLVTEDGRVWSNYSCGEIITFSDPDFHDCDSNYYLYLSFFDPVVTITQTCEKCDGFAILKAEVEYEPDCIFGDIDWTGYWVNDVLDTVGVGEELRIFESGTFFYQLHVVYIDEKTSKVQQCDLEGLPIWHIKALDIDIETIPISGTSPVCPSTLGTYELDSFYLFPCEYRWTIPEGNGRIITKNFEDSTKIQVDWSKLAGNSGKVCLSVLTDCATTPDTCFIVEFLNAPKPDAGPDAILCQRDYKMTGKIDVAGGNWEIVKAPGNVIFDENDITTDISVDKNGEYIFVWRENTLECDGLDTIKIIFNTNPQPGQVDTICNKDATNYTIVFDINEGTAPFTIIQGGGSIDQNNIYTSDVLQINQNYTIIVKDTFGCQFELNLNHECTCSNEVGIVSSDTIKACGNSTVNIDYNSTNSTAGTNDTFHYVLYTQLGDIIGSELNRNHTGSFTFNPATMVYGQIYYLGVASGKKDAIDYVDYLGGCLKIAEGQPVVWYEMPMPNAGADFDVCASNITLVGIQSLIGSNIKWLTTPGSVISNPNSTNSSVTVNNFGRYTFIFQEKNNICNAQDSVVINFFESPDISNIVKTCIDFGSSTEWKYTLNISKGNAPYTIIEGDGNYDAPTGIFTSNNLASLKRDILIVEDANGCRDTISLIHNCECGLTKRGTMTTSLSEICLDSCLTITTNNDHGTEPDDCVYMVLHTDSASIDRSKIIDIQLHKVNGNEFCFDESKGMLANIKYYISYIVGECDNSGDIDLEDACLKIISKPVIFVPYPKPDAGSNLDICGLSTQFGAIPSIGIGTWTLVNSPAGSNTIFDKSLPSGNISVDQYGSYTFKWTENNGGCENFDEVTINFNDAPIATNIKFQCDSVAENYRIVFDIEQGDNLSWNAKDISGWIATSLGGNTYRTPWIPSGKSVEITISDKFDCKPFIIKESHICDCITKPGTINASPLIFCVDGEANVTHNGFVLDPNDVVVFYLHNGDQSNIGANIISSNNTGKFVFDATKMQLNTTYFITVRVGSKSNNGEINLSDRCISETKGIPVIWFKNPTAIITSILKTLTCEVDTIELDGSSSINNSGVGELLNNWSTIDGKYDDAANLNSNTVKIVKPGTYRLTITNDSTGCIEFIEYIIDENRLHINVDAGVTRELTCDVTSVTLDGSKSDLSGNVEIKWIGPGINSTNQNEISPVVTKSGTYTLIVTNKTTECNDDDEVIVTEDYTKPTADIKPIGGLTCANQSMQLDGNLSTSINGIRSYSWSTTNGEIDGSIDTKTISITSAGAYTLIVVDSKTGCKDTILFNATESDNTLEAIELTKQDLLCEGDELGNINITNIIGGISPLTYSINGGAFNSQSNFSDLGPGDHHIVIRDNNGCEIDTFITLTKPAPIDIKAKEDLTVLYGGNADLDSLWHELTGTTELTPGTEIFWLDNKGNMVNPKLTNLTLPINTFTVVVTDANGCEARDIINIYVKVERKVFIPNIFSPEASIPANTIFKIHSAPGSIERITSFKIYDRWGEQVYQNEGDILFDQNGTSLAGWDGTLQGQQMNPAVYIYYIELVYTDYGNGTTEEKVFGDITLIR